MSSELLSRARIVMAAPHSGAGKTTVTLAILSALKARGLALSAFKCGPDYVDPMFQREILNLPSHNLDAFFLEPEEVRRHFLRYASPELSVIEGVMGYYDGIGLEGRASTYEIARILEAPVILVISAAGMYTSAAAILTGFLNFRQPSQIAGVIFNDVSEMVYQGLARLAGEVGVTALGYLPRRPELSVPDRRLGLVTAAEIDNIQEILASLGHLAAETIDLDGLIEMAGAAAALKVEERLPALSSTAMAPQERRRLAVAQDRAFCFIYQENLDLLRECGVEIVPFSPLEDSHLPEGIDGLYLPGGYPEIYSQELSANASLREEIRERILGGLPTWAEGGGFVYLHESYEGVPLVGAISAEAHDTDRLQRFGYIELMSQENHVMARRGESIRAHEFHYTASSLEGSLCLAKRASGSREYQTNVGDETLFAGFPQLYLPANPHWAERFSLAMSACRRAD